MTPAYEYREVAPPPALAPFVRCFWRLWGRLPAAEERIVPDGCFELIIHRGAPFAQNGLLQERALLIGEIRRPTLIRPSATADVSGVRFNPGGAAAFFPFPMSEVRDAILPAKELIPTEGDGWENVLSKRRTVPPQWRAVSAAVSIIRSRRGNVRIGRLAGMIGIGERTLQRAFEQYVGMPAKTFARLIRFHAYLAAPEQDTGYCDASHLNRDFVEFAGVTPAQYARERHVLCDNFVGNIQYSNPAND